MKEDEEEQVRAKKLGGLGRDDSSCCTRSRLWAPGIIYVGNRRASLPPEAPCRQTDPRSRASSSSDLPSFLLPLDTHAFTMPPQPGVFALPYASTHKPRVTNGAVDSDSFHPSNFGAGPSRMHGQFDIFCAALRVSETAGTPVDDPTGKRKRKELASRPSREHLEG